MRLTIAALAVLAPGLAFASSEESWEKLFARAEAACRRASELKHAAMLGRPVDFSDRVLVLVKGRWPQPHMKNRQAIFACLYDKRSGEAEAQEATALE